MSEDEEKPELTSSIRNPSKPDEKKRKRVMPPGTLMKAVVRSGEATAMPALGDMVIVHCVVRTLDGVIVESTRSEHGGKDVPIRYILGKSNMLLGLSEGIPTMVKGEVSMFKMKPEVHYGEDDCPVSPPANFPKEDELHFEIELIDFFKVKAVSEDLGVLKKVVDGGAGWETPREPYEIKARVVANAADGRIIIPRRDEPFFFTFGKGEVPRGLEMGIGAMSRGEKAILYVDQQYLTPSPFMSTEGLEDVRFEVELVHFVQVRDMLGDGRLIKRRIVDGRGEFPMDCPLQDSLLRVHYKAMLLDKDKTAFYDTRINNNGQPLEFSSGEGLVPEGLEMCVRLMLPGEVALVTCPPDFAYDKFPRPNGVPEGAHIMWEIELLGFEMPKDWTGLTFQEIMDEAERIKNTGNRLFKEGKFELAKAKYEKVLRDYNHVTPHDDEEGRIFLNSRNSLHLNVAACYQKIGEYRKSIDSCNKVLDGNPTHAKALYRRGMAYMLLGDFDQARDNFNTMIEVDKSSEPDARSALLKVKHLEQDTYIKARKQFKGLFDKKPGEISEVGTEVTESGTKADGGHESEATSTDKMEGDSDTINNGANITTEREGWFSRFWPLNRRFLKSVGLNSCSIL